MSSKWRRWISANSWPVFSLIPSRESFPSRGWYYTLFSAGHWVRSSPGPPHLQQGLSLADYLTLQEPVLQQVILFCTSMLCFLSSSLCPYSSTDCLHVSQTHICLVGVGHSLVIPSISSSSSCHKPQLVSSASVLPAEGIHSLHQSKF